MAKQMNKPEAFYTGGGIWLSCMYTDEKHYYCISNYAMDGLSFYCTDDEDDDVEYACQNMLRAMDLEELNGEELSIYLRLRAELKKFTDIIQVGYSYEEV